MNAWLLLSIFKPWSHGHGQSVLQLRLPWIISWLTPDTFVSLTEWLPTDVLPNGLRPPILQVPIADSLIPVQTQALSN